MRAVFLLVLVIGVGLAGFAVYMARGYITDYQTALAQERLNNRQQVELTQVLVVNKQVDYGDVIREEDMRPARFPVNALPEGVFANLEEMFPEGEQRYRTVLRTMEENEVILATKVTEPGGDAGVSSRLSAGMRAFAIRVDVSSGVSGFLRPGDRVDIYWTGRADTNDEGRAQGVTMLIDSNVSILAIDQTTDVDRSSATIARTITVEATPRQVAALAQAQATGRMSLSLVGNADETAAGAVEVNQNELLGIERVQVDAPVAQQVCTVRTRRGADIIETPVACPQDADG